ncbi:MAG: MATE family efflux transporter [Acidobacteriota bacterium]|nr:MATE family efflux transporter [Acidobacteriota bacterium]
MQDLTTGSLTGHLLKTTSFMLVSMVFQTLYVLVDLFWVGRLGTDAVAAVGISANLSFVVLALSQMLGVGTTTVVSHAAGRKEHTQATYLFNQSQVLSMAAGLVFLAVAMYYRTAYAAALSADVTMQAQTEEYLLWFIPAMALQFAMVAMGAALRGTGNFKPGMYVQTGTVVLNMALTPILIFGWGPIGAHGIGGAALSTLIAVAIGVIWISFYFLNRDAYLHFRLADWVPAFPVWGRMLKIGLPAGAEFAMMAIYMVVVYSITRPFGAAAQAGFGIGLRIVQSAFLPVVALGFAVAPVAGQNFGAGKGQRVRQAFTVAASMAGGVMLASGVAVYLAATPLMGLFSADPEVIRVGVEYLHIVTINFVASGITFVSASMFQAMGNTLPSLATSFLRLMVGIVPAAVLSSRPEFALTWIWWLTVLSTTLQMALNLVLLQREFRLKLA